MIKEIQSKKILTHHADAFPTNWDLNPYHGCSIGCVYCYAQYTHKYLELNDFHKDILVKTNAPDCLAKELKNKNWKHEQIKIGGTTDLYQHAEKKYQLIPQLFDVTKKYKNPVFIQTKSTLVLRDLEIIRDLSKLTTVDIATSISTFDESIRKVIEPGAPSAMDRIKMLAKFKGICRSTTLGFMPIIPLLSDNDENLDTAFRTCKEFGLDNIVCSILFLRGDLKPLFFKMIETNFPFIYTNFARLYAKSNVDESYAQKINIKIAQLRKKYDLYGVYTPVKMTSYTNQLSLFA